MSSLLPQFDASVLMQTMVCILFASTPKGRGVPAVVVGDPGTAKSAHNEAIFSQLGLVHRTISPGLKGEAFFGVSPVPTESADDIGQRVMTFPPPETLLPLTRAQGSVLYIDEMNAVVSSAQLPAMLGALQDRMVGDLHLGTHCRVFAAMNPQHIAANGVRISIPQANRLSQWQWHGVSERDRSTYLKRLTKAPAGQPWRLERDAVTDDELRQVLEDRMDACYESAMATAQAMCHEGFLRAHPDRRQMMPQASSKEAVSPWPSDRSWTNAMSLYAASLVFCSDRFPIQSGSKRADFLRGLRLDETRLRDLQESLIASCVGMEAAQLFSQWSRKLDLPDVEAWCLGQERRNPAPRNGDNAVFIAGLQSWLNAHLGNKSVVHNPARVGDRVMEYVSWLCANAMMDMAIMISQELFASKEHTEFYFPGSPSPKRAEAIAALRMSSSELQALKNKVNN
jgi:MoxR-like ATPase